VIIGYVAFAEWPDRWTWIGAAVIIASGLYIFHRERRLQKLARLDGGGT
jgi:drug/metabolite transporter (DMT)-like permease